MSIYGNYLHNINIFENYINTPNSNIISVDESIDLDEGFGAKLRPVFIVLLYSDSTFDRIAEKFVK